MILVRFEKNILLSGEDGGYGGVQEPGQGFNKPHTYRDDF